MLPVDSTIIGPLRNSGIGKYVKVRAKKDRHPPFNRDAMGEVRVSLHGRLIHSRCDCVALQLLTLHPKETPENKRLAHSLVEKWTRVIFHSSTGAWLLPSLRQRASDRRSTHIPPRSAVATASKLTTVAAPRVPEESQHDLQSLDGEGSASQPTASRCVRAPASLPLSLVLRPRAWTVRHMRVYRAQWGWTSLSSRPPPLCQCPPTSMPRIASKGG